MPLNATIVEVARKSGTSLSTVSRVLSNSAYPVNEKTRKRVVEAAEALGYRPNSAARMLRSRRSMYIAAIVPSLNNPFYSTVISAIEQEVLASGYMLQMYSSNNDPELESRLLDLIGSVQAAALLISSMNWNEKLERKIRDLGIPAVFFDQIPKGYSGHYVGFDFHEAGRMAAEFLISEGHRDIAFGCGPFDRESRRQYRNGFCEVLDEAGISSADAIVSIAGAGSMHEYEMGVAIADELLRRKGMPTAVAVINDIAALGVIKRLEIDGVNVPFDVSVMGFDDIPYGFMMTPSLTTIRQPAEETGRMATRLAVSLIGDPGSECMNEIFHPVLIRRESVRRIGRIERKENSYND